MYSTVNSIFHISIRFKDGLLYYITIRTIWWAAVDSERREELKAPVPEMGTRRRTLSALRILYRESATTCWHQKMSFVSQLHVTDVILHLGTSTVSQALRF
jgi:hypothetical protein